MLFAEVNRLDESISLYQVSTILIVHRPFGQGKKRVQLDSTWDMRLGRRQDTTLEFNLEQS